MKSTSRRRRGVVPALAVAVTLTSLLASCGGDSTGPESADGVETGLAQASKPVRGGQVVYGLEAESDSYCLSSAQFALPGIQVSRAIFDPIVVPDPKAEGGYAPYLVKSLTPSSDYRTWTVALRPNVTFHDGSKLDATVFKNNIDAFRGKYPNRSSLLFALMLQNIDTVEVENELTVKITTVDPWVNLPGTLYGGGRVAIMAQAQLDADPETCRTHPIGTGPFEFLKWDEGSSLKVTRNPNYWQTAPDGKPYPYLNAVEFRVLPSSDERVQQLVKGEINMMHTSTAADIASNLPDLVDAGVINMMTSEYETETNYLMFNSSKPPFDEPDAREAAVQAIDRNRLNDEANLGASNLANGPIAPGSAGYVKDDIATRFDLAAAKKTVARLKADKKSVAFTLLISEDITVVRQNEIIKRMLQQAGFDVTLEVVDQPSLINTAIGGDYQLASFRNQPGGDPDINYPWWFGDGNPVNFGRFDDPEINDLFTDARSNPDPKVREADYQKITRRMVTQHYNVYLFYTRWAVAEASNVHGILGPPLPNKHEPPPRLVTGHSMAGIWIEPRT